MDGRLFRALPFLAAMTAAALLPDRSRADTVNNEWVSTTQARTMGNAGIAAAEDPATAAFYNPAALAKLKKPMAEVFNPQIDIGTGVFGLSTSMRDWFKHGNYANTRDLVKGKPGKVSSVGASLFPNVSSQNFSFGILARYSRWSHYEQSDATWRYYSRYLIVPSMGFSVATLGGRMRLGVAVRAIQVSKTEGTEADTTSTAVTNVSTRHGLGIGLDAGALITMPWSWLPTLGAVARNVGDTSFPTDGLMKVGSATVAGQRHEQVKMTYDAGFALSPKVGSRDVFTMAFDMRDVTNRTGAVPLRHYNAGLELASNRMFFLRAGFSQGYWTAGIGFAGKEGSFDVGTYSDEINATKSQTLEDRHISIRYSRRF